MPTGSTEDTAIVREMERLENAVFSGDDAALVAARESVGEWKP